MTLRIVTGTGPDRFVRGDRLVPPEPRPSVTITLEGGILLPGLINAHDHLHRNHYPRLGTPPYADAYAWGVDLHEHHAEALARARTLPRKEALQFGALKNLLGGVTSVVHHDPWEAAFDDGFPLRVVPVRTAHSVRLEGDLTAAAAGDMRTAGAPLCIHLAEGGTPDSADEIRTLDALGLLNNRLLAVHVVGADEDGIARLARHQVGCVWCPTSNMFLFGRTLPASLAETGVDLLLGTDALLTGEGTMLDELRAARGIGLLGDEALVGAVTHVAARRLGVAAPSLDIGARADLVLLRRPLFGATASDVALVMVGGVTQVADATWRQLFNAGRHPGETLEVGGVRKLVVAPLASIADRALGLAPSCGRFLQR